MRVSSLAVSAALVLVAATSFAHSDVSNPAVAARMQAMSDISAQMKVLGNMAKGEVDFDAAAAQAAVDTVAARAAEVPALFEAPETDPESESLPAIWDNWEDFVAKSETLETAAANATIASAADLGPALGQMGGTCKACHSKYRE